MVQLVYCTRHERLRLLSTRRALFSTQAFCWGKFALDCENIITRHSIRTFILATTTTALSRAISIVVPRRSRLLAGLLWCTPDRKWDSGAWTPVYP